MDDIFEVLIYVLFIGASVIGGIYKNYTKKKAEEQQRQAMQEVASEQSVDELNTKPEERSSMPRNLEDFLRDQFEMEMESVENTEIEEEKPIVNGPAQEASAKEGVAAFENTTAALFSDNLNDKNFSITEAINNQENSAISMEGIDDESSNIFNDDEGFDVKKAIVYSEILKRPYN